MIIQNLSWKKNPNPTQQSKPRSLGPRSGGVWLSQMPPARDTNNRDLVGGRTMGLAAGAELRKVHMSSGRWWLGACASPELEKTHFNQVRQILG